MIKKISFVAALFFALLSYSFAQELPVDKNTGKITYLEVVDADGLTAKEMYTIGKKWAADNKLVLKEDKENETLVYTGNSALDYPNTTGNGIDKGKVSYTFSIFLKDNRYRFIVTDLAHSGEGKSAGSDGGKLENVSPECGKAKMSAKGWVTIKTKADTNLKALTADLKRVYKEAQNDPSKKSDW
jgi:hypothetical protein